MIASYQAQSQTRVNAALEGLFQAPSPELTRLYDAMRYSVLRSLRGAGRCRRRCQRRGLRG